MYCKLTTNRSVRIVPLEQLSAPKIVPINIVKVYEILQGKATYNTWRRWVTL